MQLGNRTRRQRIARRRLNRHLIPGDVVPATKLEPDVPIDTDEPEPERLVKPDARGIGQRNTCRSFVVAEKAQHVEQRGIQCAPGAATRVAAINIDRRADRPSIGRALVVRGGIGITDDGSVVLEDEPGAVGADSGNARRHLVSRRRDFFERDRAPLAIRRIDGGNRGGVGSGGESNRRHGLNINGEFRRFVSSRSSRHRSSWFIPSCHRVFVFLGSWSRHRAFVPSWSRERGRRIRLPAAVARRPTHRVHRVIVVYSIAPSRLRVCPFRVFASSCLRVFYVAGRCQAPIQSSARAYWPPSRPPTHERSAQAALRTSRAEARTKPLSRGSGDAT